MENGASRVWEILFRIAVPLSVAAAGAVITHEVRLGRHDEQLKVLQRHVELSPPMWLREDLNEIKHSIGEIEKRLRSIEMKK